MTKLTPSERPERLAIDLIGQRLVFARVGDDNYTARLDDNSLPIRTEKQEKQISEGGELYRYQPKLSEGAAANIDTIILCLALGAAPTPIPRGVKLKAMDNWGHFRQNTFLTISITIAESGMIEINEDIQEQDDSYY
jgi:hypothetical protein